MSRVRYLNPAYYSGFQNSNATNTAADEIIEAPDKHLLSQDELFDAEGGLNNLAVQLTFGLVGTGIACAVNPRLISYFKNGQLRFYEWMTLGGATSAGYLLGHQIGLNAFGDKQRVTNHWVAYTFVKNQNRFEGRNILSYTPTYY